MFHFKQFMFHFKQFIMKKVYCMFHFKQFIIKLALQKLPNNNYGTVI